MEEEVLSSPDMWRCVSCYSCANRCPRGIEITDLMADLRRLAMKKGYVDDKEAVFGQAFAETVVENGRLFEPELLARYYLRALDFGSLLGMVPLGLKMLTKGKMPFVPERISKPEALDRIEVVAPVEEGKKDFVSLLVGVMTSVLGFVGALGKLLTGKGKGGA
jgi:heterodisulfide reductase subunit C